MRRLPSSAEKADEDARPELSAPLHTCFANRGVWEAIDSAGPAVSVAAAADDVDAYLGVFAELVAELTSRRLREGEAAAAAAFGLLCLVRRPGWAMRPP